MPEVKEPTKSIVLTHNEMSYILERMKGSRSKKHKKAITAKIHTAFNKK